MEEKIVDLALEGRLRLAAAGETQEGRLLVADGRVASAGDSRVVGDGKARQTLAFADGLWVPGFVDLHVHGARGCDFADGSSEAVATICRAHAAHGTTALVATILSSPPAVTLRALEVMAQATKRPADGARVLGVHLEGPFLNPRCAGAQRRDTLRLPDRILLAEYLAAAEGALRMVTIAPELPQAGPLIEWLNAEGICVAIGHSAASYEEAVRAIFQGARLVTHAYNAMSGFHHRDPGVVGAALAREELWTEVIADNVHVLPPALDILWRLKGPERLCLVTDCIAAWDAPPGQRRLGQTPVELRDGAAYLPDGSLAGSVLTMERALVELAAATGASLDEVLPTATSTPAAVLRIPEVGALASGCFADAVCLGSDQSILAVVVGGVPLA